MFGYKEAQKKQKSKYRKREAVADEDGFTLATRGGAYGKTLGSEVGKKKGAKEKPNFHVSQKHEKKYQGATSSLIFNRVNTEVLPELID